MCNEEKKSPRKQYAKPLIAFEDFTLNQFIANCTIKTRDNNNWESELKSYNPFMYDYMKATEQFVDFLNCAVHADTKVDDDMDTLCYHTSTSPLFTS